MADADAGWLMLHKHAYHPHLAHFMEFHHGCSATHDIHKCHFSRAELLLIQPEDVQRCMGLQAYNDPDCNINPPTNHQPKFCRASNLESIKKALSYCMPHCAAPWRNGQGNSTKSAPVNGIIKKVRKFEVRGEGCPSSAKRPLRENKFIKSLQLLRAHPGFDCKCKHPTLQLWQHTLIGRLDDCAHFEVDDPRGHAQFEFGSKTKVCWSKNVVEDRRCPNQACACLLLLFSSLHLCSLSNSNSLLCIDYLWAHGHRDMCTSAHGCLLGGARATSPCSQVPLHR